MTQAFENTKFGDVTVRNIVIDTDGTNLEEGIEIIVENVPEPIEIFGYRSVEDMTNDDVEEILNEHI